MSKLSLKNAEILSKLLDGENMPASGFKGALSETLISENIIQKNGRSKQTLHLYNKKALNDFLFREFEINDLEEYIAGLSNSENLTRSDLVKISGNSKTKRIRTFKGFLVNVFEPIEAQLNGNALTISPNEGTFTFIYDYDKFTIDKDVIVVGIENPENFRYINRQKHLFAGRKCLFVSRYPQNQNKDLLSWLLANQYTYLHFGDFDFSGLNIFINEFKKHLKEKAAFFVPKNIESLLQQFGNRSLYDKQDINFDYENQSDEIKYVISLIYKYKKGLEQEILIEKL